MNQASRKNNPSSAMAHNEPARGGKSKHRGIPEAECIIASPGGISNQIMAFSELGGEEAGKALSQ